MHKLFTFLFLLVISFNISQAQWEGELLPIENTGQKLCVIGEDTALIAMAKGTVLKTINGGASWYDVSTSQIDPANLLSISASEELVMVVVQDSVLIKSSDKGENWDLIPGSHVIKAFNGSSFNVNVQTLKFGAIRYLNNSTWFTTVQFSDDNTIKRAYILKTGDNGATWDTVSSDFAGGSSKICSAIEFAPDGLTGYISGSFGTMLKTVDGGSSWSVIDLSATGIASKYISDIKLVTADSVYISSQAGVYKTTDGFSTISAILDGVYSHDFDIYQDSIFLSVGKTSEIYRSLDYGKTWQAASIGATSPLYDLGYFNDLIYGLSSKGMVYKLDPDELLDADAAFDVDSIDGNAVFFTDVSPSVGTFKWIFSDSTEVDNELSGYTFLTKGSFDIELIGSNAVNADTFRVEDILVDTVKYPFGSGRAGSNNLRKLFAIDSENAVMIGTGTIIYYTSNRGKTWGQASFADSLLGHIGNDIDFITGTTGFATFSAHSPQNGFVLKTTDKGASWEPVPLDSFSDGSDDITTDITLGEKIYFYSLDAINTDTVFITACWNDSVNSGKHGFVYMSADGGNTWSISSGDLYSTYTGTITAMQFAPGFQTAYITGNKIIWKTKNYGASWTEIQSDDLHYINDLYIIDSNTVYLSTGNGVLKTDDGFKTWNRISDDIYTFDIMAINDSVFVTGKNKETFSYSMDYGSSWTYKGEGIGGTFYDLAVFNDKIYALSSNGKYYIAHIDNFLDPQASFNYTVDGLTVNLTGKAVHADTVYWSFGDDVFEGGYSLSHAYAGYGTYNVVFTAEKLCQKASASAQVTLKEVGGIDITDQNDREVKIYPNPSLDGNFIIFLPDGWSGGAVLNIYSPDGKLIYRNDVPGTGTIEINPGLPSGLYHVIIMNTYNKQISTRLIVK